MRVAVLGGSGVAGRYTVDALRADGHDPVGLSRATGVDLLTGDGLVPALAGAEAVVDATNLATMRATKSEAFFETTTRNLLSAAGEVGVGHIVALSIIGIDRVPFGYYQGKVRQEQVLAGSDIPVTVLRSAQFHEFASQYLERMTGRLVLVPTWRVQPVAAREVGSALARLAVRSPVGHQELAGPREEVMADLVRQVARRRGGARRRIVELRLPGAAGKAMARGGSLPTVDGMRGTQTFADWLAGQA
ncbi:SDR family oxidoreductase [Nocardioides sp. T2.26MG-1]|uniref:SDR family oxidoreductase n=1 Tax=Nocardioides sp. T2.26MG-1 TaxID=3041166 RepID=UPI0024779567|nr:NAD(P)H-binding protein [Nocardioides sp. T2.26MG-1]CAI9417751.1 hypothetical protein HIDPHFAB_03097 [Nocardioides sp. T2.26MG-1]